jgi:hypothetical protein
MSWDLFVQDLPAAARRVEEIPVDFVPCALGGRAAILALIQEVAPCTDCSDAAWLRIKAPGIDIEVNLGRAEVLMSFAFHVRGGEASVRLVAEILQRLGRRALDPQADGGIFDPATALHSFERWRDYRDQVGRQGS